MMEKATVKIKLINSSCAYFAFYNIFEEIRGGSLNACNAYKGDDLLVKSSYSIETQ